LTVAVPATAKHINMENCTVCKRLRAVTGNIGDYKDLAHYHYRDGRLGPFTNIFALKSVLGKTIGVIVYAMPQLALELRNIAMNNMFTGFDRSTGLALVNKNIRCIARVIIEPRFRGLGLASRLVRETMPQMQMPIIEALAVMGLVNPFFEKAGMTAYTAKLPARCVRFVEALSLVGIERAELIDENRVHRKLQQLRWSKADFIERQIQLFLQSYGRRRNMQPGLNRTRFILSKLTERPVYYIWFNQELNQFFNEKFNVNDQSN
jgi:GNAT superfamily N-acetyltransferase